MARNDADETVQRAAVQAMSKASLPGEEKTLETLRQTAQKHQRPQVSEHRFSSASSSVGVSNVPARAQVRKAAVASP